jgi:hypothetical protein
LVALEIDVTGALEIEHAGVYLECVDNFRPASRSMITTGAARR